MRIVKICYKKIFSSRAGFGMIELLITIVILGLGMFSLMGLMGMLVSADRVNTDDLIAVQLAREGVELGRYVRDSNWLQGKKWDAGLSFGNDTSAIAFYDTTARRWRIDFSPEDEISLETKLFYDPQTHLYNHLGIGDETKYHRLIIFEAICFDDLTMKESFVSSGFACAGGSYKIGVRTRAIVGWSAGSDVLKKELMSMIYNWR